MVVDWEHEGFVKKFETKARSKCNAGEKFDWHMFVTGFSPKMSNFKILFSKKIYKNLDLKP